MAWQLDISIGPVQEFVRESRRTRDLWASSYMLSFLAAHAMSGAADAGGSLVTVPDDPMHKAVRAARARSDVGNPPRIGTVPNHFQVTGDGDPRKVATAAQDALQRAWQRVCKVVWDHYVAQVAETGDGTTEIWRRQVDSFWQVIWVVGQDGTSAALLVRRKHWRSHRPQGEPGDKCTVMPAFQELSGHVRATSSDGRGRQYAFWARLRQQERTGVLDLREDERLCAVALIKRLFSARPRVAKAALGWPMETGHWPSTVWIGALPWLWQAQVAAGEKASQYAQEVKKYAAGAVRPLDDPLAGLAPPGELSQLDANYLHQGFVADPRLCPLPSAGAAERAVRAKLADQLGQLYQAEAGAGERRQQSGGPSVYYALLLADGDKLGQVVSENGRDVVGRALADFAGGPDRRDGVEALVHDHGGVTIYAGGDDVLAMLPVSRALRCAAALVERYRTAFGGRIKDGTDGKAAVTLSAAVLFTHVRLPLATALEESQRLLEEVAKERNCRDSLAVAVRKPGGSHCEWVTRWRRTGPDGQPTCAVAQIEELVGCFRGGSQEPGFSSSLLYRVREALGLLCGWPQWEPGKPRRLPPGVDARAYLRAEIHHSLASRASLDRDSDDSDRTARAASELTGLVWSLLPQIFGEVTACPDRPVSAGEQISLDPLLLARFLAQEGREEGHL